jgi:hypothetical protein
MKTEAEKVLKYKDLAIETQSTSMWNVQTELLPVTIGASAIILKSLRQYLSNITREHEIKELQKTAILGTTHILRKVRI